MKIRFFRTAWPVTVVLANSQPQEEVNDSYKDATHCSRSASVTDLGNHATANNIELMATSSLRSRPSVRW
jgi:hypothetical protein